MFRHGFTLGYDPALSSGVYSFTRKDMSLSAYRRPTLAEKIEAEAKKETEPMVKEPVAKKGRIIKRNK